MSTPTRTVKRKAPARKPGELSFADRLRNFLNLKAQLELTDATLGTLKGELSGEVEENGYQDDKGNYWFDLDEPVEANVYNEKTDTVEVQTFRKVKRQRDVRTRLDADAAEAILAKKGLLEEAQTTIVVLDEEKINKLYFTGQLKKADIDKIFPQTIGWSFRPQKG